MTGLLKTEDEVVDVPNYLAMSDEEHMAMGALPPAEEVPAESTPAELVADDAEDKADQEDKETADPAEVPAVIADPDKQEPADIADPVEKAAAEPDTDEVAEPAAVNFEAEYLRMLAPFKANGKEIAVGSVDDAIALMQMGANYNKKMAALKPNLKLMKLLENSGFLNEEKIGYLIDLGKNNPAAINKLVKDSGLDPMDLDAEKAVGYQPTTYKVDDREIELDTVLDEIQETPTYTRTLDIVSTQWDGPSKQAIAASPQLLKVINAHVQSGVYDTIAKEVERERVFGRLNGLSDIEAYRQVGDAIQAKGGFNPVVKAAAATPAKVFIAAPKPVKVDEDKLREKRRAAGSTQPAASGSVVQSFNPLAMSDEEFSKQAQPQFL